MESKYFIKTFGCQMNKYDSELLSGTLSFNGYMQTENVDDANIIVFNTCSVREKAEERVFNQLSMLRSLKKTKQELIIVVSGCMSERLKYEIKNRAPHVDIILGPSYIYELPEMIENVKNGLGSQLQVGTDSGQRIDTDVEKINRVSPFSAWIAIMRGCNNFCSYCVVPYVRGREWSRPVKDIIFEIERLRDDGIYEVTLLGQNVNSYNDNAIDFPELLKEVNSISGIKRIRFITSHPKDFSEKLIDVITDCENVCEHINLPVQSGSNRILELMDRGYTRENYLRKIELIKKRIPDVALTADVIVGFPTESDEDFNDTMDLIRKVEYDAIFGFFYSERSGTKAAEMVDDIPHKIKIERLQELIKLQREYNLKNNMKMVGKTVQALVEKVSKKEHDEVCGRTRTNKIVNFKGNTNLIGSFVDVKVINHGPNSLMGEMHE